MEKRYLEEMVTHCKMLAHSCHVQIRSNVKIQASDICAFIVLQNNAHPEDIKDYSAFGELVAVDAVEVNVEVQAIDESVEVVKCILLEKTTYNVNLTKYY